MSYDFWDESQKKHTTQAWLILFFTLGTLPAPWGCTVIYRENATQKPRWKAATIIESMRAHESLVDLSSQITNFLLKSWTLSSSDKTFLVLSFRILTLRIYERNHCSVPLNLGIICYAITLPRITMIYIYYLDIYIYYLYRYYIYICIYKLVPAVPLECTFASVKSIWTILYWGLTYIYIFPTLPVNKTRDMASDD